MIKNIKPIITILIPLLLLSCGFKPLNKKNNNIIYIKNIEITGEERIAYLLKNNFLLISDDSSVNIYDIKIDIKKKKSSKIKDTTGKTSRYSLLLDVNLVLTNLDDKTKIQKKFTRQEDFNVHASHSNTINNEKTAQTNIIQTLSNDMVNFIILSMRNK